MAPMIREPFREIKYLSFDCYGTLVDWENGILDAIRPFVDWQQFSEVEMLQKFAASEAKQESGPYRPYREILTDVFRDLVANAGSHTPESWTLLADSVASWRPFPDTITTLKALSQCFSLAVLSNIDNSIFVKTEKGFGISFSHVVTAEDLQSYKPNRKNFEALLQTLRCKKNEVLHVAQSLYHDHIPAKEMGLTTVWVNRPSRIQGVGATLPADVRPDYEVESLSALRKLLVKSRSVSEDKSSF